MLNQSSGHQKRANRTGWNGEQTNTQRKFCKTDLILDVWYARDPVAQHQRLGKKDEEYRPCGTFGWMHKVNLSVTLRWVVVALTWFTDGIWFDP